MLGIYTDRERAEARCTSELEFVWPWTLDTDPPRERTEIMLGAYWPWLENKS